MKTTPEQCAKRAQLADDMYQGGCLPTLDEHTDAVHAIRALLADLEEVKVENESLRQQLAASDAALLESRANDREAMRQLAEYRQDAERYRWLCNVATEPQWIEFGGYTVKKYIDAAIDSAMNTQEGE